MNLLTPRGVVFDLDNTLLDRTRALRAWLRGECGFDEQATARALEVDGFGYGDRTAFCEWLAATTGEGTAASQWARFRETFPAYVVRDESVLALLDRMSTRFAVGVLTNGSVVNQRAKIAKLGLREILEPHAILISEEIRFSKPDRRAFELAAARVGVTPSRVVFVGDHPDLDMIGARAAGMGTCWLSHGRVFPHDEGPDWTVDSLAEVEALW